MAVAKAKVDQQTRSRYHARESMELVSSAGKYGAGVGTGTKREKKALTRRAGKHGTMISSQKSSSKLVLKICL